MSVIWLHSRAETDSYTVADHVAVLNKHLSSRGMDRRRWLDAVLANDNLSVSPKAGGGQTVFVEPVAPVGERLVMVDLIDEERPWRHDSQKLARAIVDLLGAGERGSGIEDRGLGMAG